MGNIRIRKDLADEVVEVKTPDSDGWDRYAPEAAHQLADSYRAAIAAGDVDDVAGTRQFIETLEQYANDLED